MEPLLVVPDLDLAPPVQAVGAAAQSMSQQPAIQLEPLYCTRAVGALSSMALETRGDGGPFTSPLTPIVAAAH